MGGSRSGSLNPTCNYEAILKSSSANLSEGSITWSIGTIATPRCSYRPFYPLEWSLKSMGFESLRQGQPNNLEPSSSQHRHHDKSVPFQLALEAAHSKNGRLRRKIGM